MTLGARKGGAQFLPRSSRIAPEADKEHEESREKNTGEILITPEADKTRLRRTRSPRLRKTGGRKGEKGKNKFYSHAILLRLNYGGREGAKRGRGISGTAVYEAIGMAYF